MAIDWPKNMTRFPFGSPGKSMLRGMEMEAGGMDGIRHIERRMADGSVYILRTRNGFPEVTVTRPVAVSIPVDVDFVRGFVAHIVDAQDAALFSPYSLLVLDDSYKMFEHTYTVLPFSSTYNVPSGDVTHWNDVISFYDGKIRINGKLMPDLGISSVDDGIPWVIPLAGSGVEKYGDKEANLIEKRVFSIGYHSVHSWATGAVDAVLNGASYRPTKALPLGPRIEASTHEAWLAQLVFTGETWDDLLGGWGYHAAHVAMLLTPPYLSKTLTTPGVVQPSCVPAHGTTTTSETHAPTSLPSVEIAVVGTGTLGAGDHSTMAYVIRQVVNFPFNAAISREINGNHDINSTNDPWQNNYTLAPEAFGRTFSVVAENSKTIRSKWETYSFPAVSIPLFSGVSGGNVVSDTGNYAPYTMVTKWSTEPGNYTPRGRATYTHVSGNVGASATFTTSEQTGFFQVVLGGIALVDVRFSRNTESGNAVTPTAVTGRYASPLANPSAYVGTGHTGLGSASYIECILQMPVTDYPTYIFTGTISDRIAQLMGRAGGYVGGSYFDYWPTAEEPPLYEASVAARPPVNDTTLTWDTTDFILYDEPNQVFISIDGHFSGAQSFGEDGLATLTVNLTIKTPLGVATQTLLTYGTMHYGDLLPEEVLTGVTTHIPSPRLSLMFLPAHQEQGDFRGAAYTTAAEVMNGADPAYLVNFVLKLDTFVAIGSDTSGSPNVNFIPANLLEMLYAYVYSQRYGVDEYQRYPVDFPVRFAEINDSLFSNQWHVNYRDGSFVDWLDTLGGAYVTEQTTELYRI